MNNEKLYNSGVLTETCRAVLPPKELWEKKKGGLVIIECPHLLQPMPYKRLTGAVVAFKDINDQPEIDYEKCTGCGMCVAKCPGLARFVIDLTFSEGKALLKLLMSHSYA